MTLNRYAKRRDETEPGLVADLRKCGFQVRRQDFPDLVIRNSSWPPGVVKLVEVEGITRYRKRKLQQLKFLEDWGIPIVKTLEQALASLKLPESQSKKL